MITLEELRKNQFKYRKILDNYCKEQYKDSQSCNFCIINQYFNPISLCKYDNKYLHIRTGCIFTNFDENINSFSIPDNFVVKCINKIKITDYLYHDGKTPNEPKKDSDAVNPKHYNGYTSLSCIDTMCVIFGLEETCHFCLCNSFKYLWRYKDKNGEEDIKKAKWYLDYVKNIYVDKDLNKEKNTEILKHHSRLCDLYSFVCDTYNKN